MKADINANGAAAVTGAGKLEQAYPTPQPQRLPAAHGSPPLCASCIFYDRDGWSEKIGLPICTKSMSVETVHDASDLVHGGKAVITMVTCAGSRVDEAICGSSGNNFMARANPTLLVLPAWVFDEPECLRPTLMVRLWRKVQGYFQRANV